MLIREQLALAGDVVTVKLKVALQGLLEYVYLYCYIPLADTCLYSDLSIMSMNSSCPKVVNAGGDVT